MLYGNIHAASARRTDGAFYQMIAELARRCG
jgi:hypothetical protein